MFEFKENAISRLLYRRGSSLVNKQDQCGIDELGGENSCYRSKILASDPVENAHYNDITYAFKLQRYNNKHIKLLYLS